MSDPLGQGAQVAGVYPDPAQVGTGHLHGGPYRLVDGVGVRQEGGVPAQGIDLRHEGVAFLVVQQRE